MKEFEMRGISRRGFLKGTIATLCFSTLPLMNRVTDVAANPINPLFWIKNIPNQPFYGGGNGNYHAGMDCLLNMMGTHGLKFYRSSQETSLSGPSGMIEPNDVVLIKVNAQWKYRGCTNSDLIRGLIQRILDHPDGFNGEVVIIENGQSQGSLNGNALGWGSYPDYSIHANANDEGHSFLYLVNTVFHDPRVSAFLLDPIRTYLIGATDHSTNGYRTYENVSYPCFTTSRSHRVELQEGIWNGNSYNQNLKLINVPVLKIHGGSEITASLKHFYGVVSMADGVDNGRHYSQLGNTCGKMVVSVRTPVLNIIDAIWVSHGSLSGYPTSTTFRANQILASQDPVALDYWATKYILYPKTKLPNHLPTYPVIDQWLTQARDIINARGGLLNANSGIQVKNVTKDETEMLTYLFRFNVNAVDFDGDGKADISIWRPGDGYWYNMRSSDGGITQIHWGTLGDVAVPGDYDGDGKADIAAWRPSNGFWYIIRSSDGGITQTQWGAPEDIPVPGDYDGDGKADIAVWRPSNGYWYIKRSSDQGVTQTQWGTGTLFANSDIPVPGDYDGDGKTDIAVWRPGDGYWYIKRSLDGGITQTQWGAPEDIPVPGDYDGDGKADIAVWRPSNGYWYIKRSSDGGITQTQWGAPEDIPVPGDYDGDGKADIVVWRPSNGYWYIKRSSDGGVVQTQWGAGWLNDEPISQ